MHSDWSSSALAVAQKCLTSILHQFGFIGGCNVHLCGWDHRKNEMQNYILLVVIKISKLFF